MNESCNFANPMYITTSQTIRIFKEISHHNMLAFERFGEQIELKLGMNIFES